MWRRKGWLTEVDLERCVNSASTLDIIMQDCQKPFMSSADLGDMLRALDDLLYVQAHICPGGQDRRFDPTNHLISMEVERIAEAQ